jgi:uncharacterized protein YndB with AHSA1/START domain
MKVEHSVIIAASPERVWNAWINDMSLWWVKPYYNDAERATGHLLEPKLGGRYIEKWGEDGAGFLIGTVVEWLPPLRLAHTWLETGHGGLQTLVRLELAQDGACTRLTFTHSGFEQLPEGAKEREQYQGGWEDLIGRFKTYAEKG